MSVECCYFGFSVDFLFSDYHTSLCPADPWQNEGSGGSGEAGVDFLDTATMTSTSTPTPSPSDVTTVVSSVLREVLLTTTSISTQGQPASVVSGIVAHRLYIFVAVLLALVAVAVGICVYIKFFHARNESVAITPPTR